MPFSELIGQDAAVESLRRAWQRQRLAHALLFTGPEGVGKRTAAVALAQALNCLTPKGQDACGACSSCRRIASGSFPDVRVLEPDGKSLKIEQMREQLQADAYLKPMEGRAKVYVLDTAEALTPEAANSLLKILEEPPEAVTIVLVTSQPFALLPTIRSRCREVRFAPLSAVVLAPWLQARLKCAPETAQTLARLSGGRPGEALRWATEEQQELRREVLSAARPQAGTDWAGQARRFNDHTAELPEALALLLTWYRDGLLLSLGGAPDLIINVDRRDELAAAAAAEPPEAWERRCQALLTALDQLHRNVNPQLLLDVMFMRLAPTVEASTT
jgi:DNA polymerase III subunit delta'